MRFTAVSGLEWELGVGDLTLARLYFLLTLALLEANVEDELPKLPNIKKPPL